MEKQGYKLTVQYFKNAGAIWFVLSVLLIIIADLQIVLGIFSGSDFFWYGKLKPFIHIALIFGGIGSLFMSSVYKELDRIPVDQMKPEFLGFISFIIYQLALVFGFLTAMLGFNKGRLYGEMNFISDNLLMLVFTILIIITLIHSYKYGKLSANLQIIIVILAGMITSYFLGNFGFPNSYITTVPPTSGFQDVFVQNFYNTAIFVYFIVLPLFYILYSIMVDVYKINTDNYDYINILLFLAILVPFTAGSNLNQASFQNFWTAIGNYVSSAIDLILIAIAYYLHIIYVNNKQNQPLFVVRVTGILLFIILLLDFLVKLPIFAKYLQYTSLDAVNFIDKIIYVILPVFAIYIANLRNQTKLSSMWVNVVFTLGILGLLFISFQALIQSHSIFSMTDDGNFIIKNWSEILNKINIFIWLKILIEIVLWVLSFYLLLISEASTKEISEQKVA